MTPTLAHAPAGTRNPRCCWSWTRADPDANVQAVRAVPDRRADASATSRGGRAQMISVRGRAQEREIS